MAEVLGTDDDDFLEGAETDDVLRGGRGADLLIGGAGADIYVFEEGDSRPGDGLIDPSFLDAIVDFEPADRLLFQGAPAPTNELLWSGIADDYEGALSAAQDAFDGGFEYASIKVGPDVFVFALSVDSVVKLEGVDPSQVTVANFASDTPEEGLPESGGAGDDLQTFIDGANTYDAGEGDDTVRGGAGTDSVAGGDGADQVYAGAGDDSVGGGEGANYLRGEAGDDFVAGGDDFDDINGNMGRDMLQAGGGDDWVRGGKDDDIVFAGEGDDLAFGDLGSDTVGGGVGDDVVRGGDGADIVRGDGGADTLHGEAGDDTLSGGLGADVFAFAEGGDLDVVTDFDTGEGDRVFLDADAVYEVAQEGADTVITLADGARMVLDGVQLSTLPSDWLQLG